MAKTEIIFGELSGGGKYDILPFRSVAANTNPTFTTKGKAKAVWMFYVPSNMTGRAIVWTNVNPTTGETDDNTAYIEDSSSGESTKTNQFVITDNSVAWNGYISSQITVYAALAYTY